MATPKFIIKNVSGGDISIQSHTIVANDSYEVPTRSVSQFYIDSSLATFINDGTVNIDNGTTVFSQKDALAYVQYLVTIPDTSSLASPVPQVIADQSTFTVATNTQVCHANTIIVQSGGILVTEGTASIVWIK